MFLLLLSPAIGQAEEVSPGAHETVIAGDYFGAGANASPGSAVEGDAFIAGAQVELNKPVNGDALLAGGGVSVSDRVGGDLYATGGSVLIDAPVAGNARLAGGHVEITKRGQPVSSLALGLVTIICAPIAVALLILTIVGIPVAFMLLLAWPMILIFGYLGGVMVVSDAIAGPSASAKGRRIVLLAMGLGAMLLFARVPFAGWFMAMLLLVMGVGAMALNAMGATLRVRIRKEKRVVPVGETEPGSRQEPTFRVD